MEAATEGVIASRLTEAAVATRTGSSQQTPAPVLSRQRRAGQRPSLVQTKLHVGASSDTYEIEADRIAERVVRALANGPDGGISTGAGRVRPMHDWGPADLADASGPVRRASSPPSTARIQRASYAVGAEGGTLDDQTSSSIRSSGGRPLEPTVRTGAGRVRPMHDWGSADLADASGPVRRALSPPSTARIQRASSAVGAEGGTLDDQTSSRIRSSGGRPLEPTVRTSMEGAFGADFSSVRVHTGSEATALNDQMQARAFTTGSDVFFRNGVPDTSRPDGLRLLAHELTHVVQQGPPAARRHTVDCLPGLDQPIDHHAVADDITLADSGRAVRRHNSRDHVQIGDLRVQRSAESEASMPARARGGDDRPLPRPLEQGLGNRGVAHLGQRAGTVQRHPLRPDTLAPVRVEGVKQQWSHESLFGTELAEWIEAVGTKIPAKPGQTPDEVKKMREERMKAVEVVSHWEARKDSTYSKLMLTVPAYAEGAVIHLNCSANEWFNPDGKVNATFARHTIVHEIFHAASVRDHGTGLQNLPLADEGGDPKDSLDEAITDTLASQLVEEGLSKALGESPETGKAPKHPGEVYTSNYFTKSPVLESAPGPGTVERSKQGALPAAWTGQLLQVAARILEVDVTFLQQAYFHDPSELVKLMTPDKVTEVKAAWLEEKKKAVLDANPGSKFPENEGPPGGAAAAASAAVPAAGGGASSAAPASATRPGVAPPAAASDVIGAPGGAVIPMPPVQITGPPVPPPPPPSPARVGGGPPGPPPPPPPLAPAAAGRRAAQPAAAPKKSEGKKNLEHAVTESLRKLGIAGRAPRIVVVKGGATLGTTIGELGDNYTMNCEAIATKSFFEIFQQDVRAKNPLMTDEQRMDILMSEYVRTFGDGGYEASEKLVVLARHPTPVSGEASPKQKDEFEKTVRHEVGHYQQHVESDIKEDTVPSIVIEYHNILFNENQPFIEAIDNEDKRVAIADMRYSYKVEAPVYDDREYAALKTELGRIGPSAQRAVDQIERELDRKDRLAYGMDLEGKPFREQFRAHLVGEYYLPANRPDRTRLLGEEPPP